MTGLIRKILVFCVLVAAFTAPSMAVAAGGQISFSGAIMEPTCGIGAGGMAAITSVSAEGTILGRFVCGSEPGQSSRPAVQPYTLSVVNLVSTTLASDHLIGYFVHYLKAAGKNEADLRLLTQTYE
ncbi:hypothetical protein [Dyella tabacisoli]|uniref:Type 1 fimbrial protein n=1 Tax=Dyella tabacisoli TaxID=2282381 RepID=A0A369UQZ6_9GAMM|nr:hypothetical protein [Dyella tabacisoli]RDD80739.1 hypothetical protein DVJ77_16035 [Dyella tabacisoli]